MELPQNALPEMEYTLDKMKAATKMCLERTSLMRLNERATEEAFEYPYMTDKEYIRTNAVSERFALQTGLIYAMLALCICLFLLPKHAKRMSKENMNEEEKVVY